MSAVRASPSDSFADPSDPNDGCLGRLRQVLPTLDGARRRVAEQIVRDPRSVQGLSIGDLARLCGVSENAVSRLTHAAGYSGYRAFSQALLVDLGRLLGESHDQPLDVLRQTDEAGDSLTGLVARVFDLEIACIRDTLANLAEPSLEQAIGLLASARRVALIGTGSAAPLCQMAHYRLSNLGLWVAWTADPMVMVSEVAQCGPGDVVLGVSYSGQSRATVEVLGYARERRRASTVALTAVASSRIFDVSDVALLIAGPNVSAGSRQFSARISGMVLLEALATAVAVKKHGTSVPGLSELGEVQARINNVGRSWRPAFAGGRRGER
ncbi:MAG: MurR/RpiR family transcriptional regulator [Chloroflexi bacterium]|nr:MurR/RpiR family transcriptional regulator [Chloroflexota bacterium]